MRLSLVQRTLHTSTGRSRKDIGTSTGASFPVSGDLDQQLQHNCGHIISSTNAKGMKT